MGTRVFDAGDIIKVTPLSSPHAIIGEALDSRTGSGWAYFSVRTNDGLVWEFNLNCDEVQVLYKRGEQKPKTNSIWIVQTSVTSCDPLTPFPTYGWAPTREEAQKRCNLLNSQGHRSRFVPLKVFPMQP